MKLKLLTLIAILPLLGFAQGPQSDKQTVVFDCSSADKKYVASRLWLIDTSIKEYLANNTPYDVVLTIHSGCTDIVSKNVADDNKMMKNIHKKLAKLSAHENVSIEACQIAVDRFDIKHTDLHPFMKLVPNSITRVIKLQNDGYAFIPFSK
ncbi:DsrE family protein [Sulfurovum sp.]|uniref:DsrE family protein n=1 Tax=Sulfurovum sp. TaxID=1969726 RepID=UPI002867B33C|nr:DsrE family protein [Sulfurovum sp.]